MRPTSRMLSAISFGVFCRSAPSTSAIMRSRKLSPGSRRDAHHQPVGDDAGAAGDRRAVAAGFADDRRGLAGDGGFVDRGDALDDLAVGGDQVAGLDEDEVADAQARLDTAPSLAVRRPAASASRRRLGLGGAERVGPRLAAALGHRLGEVGEEDGEPEPGRDLADEARRRRRRWRGRGRRARSSERATTSVTNITGLRTSVRGSSLANADAAQRGARDRRVEQVRLSALSDVMVSDPRERLAGEDARSARRSARGRARGRRSGRRRSGSRR